MGFASVYLNTILVILSSDLVFWSGNIRKTRLSVLCPSPVIYLMVLFYQGDTLAYYIVGVVVSINAY